MKKVLLLVMAVTFSACRTPDVRNDETPRMLYEGLVPEAAAERSSRAYHESFLQRMEELPDIDARTGFIRELPPETIVSLYDYLEHAAAGEASGDADRDRTVELIRDAHARISIGDRSESVPAVNREYEQLRFTDDRASYLASLGPDRLELLERHVSSRTLYASEKDELLELIGRVQAEQSVRSTHADAYRKYLLLTMMPEREQRIAALAALDEETRDRLAAFMESEWFRSYGESSYSREMTEAGELAEQERLEQERAARERARAAEQERLAAAQRAEQERIEAEREAEADRLGAEQERLAAEQRAEQARIEAERLEQERARRERLEQARMLPPLFRDIPWESSPREVVLHQEEQGATVEFVTKEYPVPDRLPVESYFAVVPVDRFGYKASLEYRFWIDRFFEGRYWILAPDRADTGHYASVIGGIREQLELEFGEPTRSESFEAVWEFEHARIVLTLHVDRGVKAIQVRYAWSEAYTAVERAWERYHIGKDY